MKPVIEPRSLTWRFIEQHAGLRLAALRLANDRKSLDATDTAHTRGQIAAWKELLALATPAPAQPAGDQE